MKVLVEAPRTVSSPTNTGGDYKPWVEVTLVFRLKLTDWGRDEMVFLHWAAPWREGEACLAWKLFDPARRAGAVGVPAGIAEKPQLSQTQAEALVAQVRNFRPKELYRHQQLGLLANLGESFSSFRHRCLKAFAPVVKEGLLRRDPKAAQAVARILDGIECHNLGEDELEELEARVGFAFYPSEVEPQLAQEDLMTETKLKGYGFGNPQG
ncbi:MAG: hypothetical protein ACUVRE_08205 [Thermoanaerobaculaceae bacterium]